MSEVKFPRLRFNIMKLFVNDVPETETEIAYSPAYHQMYYKRLLVREYQMTTKFKWNEMIVPKELSDSLKERMLLPTRFPQFFVNNRRPDNILVYGVIESHQCNVTLKIA